MTGRYSLDPGRSFSNVSAIAVGVAIAALVVAALAVGLVVAMRGNVDSLERRLRDTERAVAALELEQRQLNETIGNATEAASIAKAILLAAEE